MTDAVREGARRAVLADGSGPLDSVYAPMWRYLAQSRLRPDLCDDGACVMPPARHDLPGRLRQISKTSGENITVKLSLPYRIWVLGNKPILMTSTYTVRNE